MEDLPNPLTELADELLVANVAFAEQFVEIDFFDPRRQGPGVVEFTKLSLDRTQFLDSIEFIEEHLRDLVDEALRERRK